VGASRTSRIAIATASASRRTSLVVLGSSSASAEEVTEVVSFAMRVVDDCRAAAADDARAQLEERLASLAPVGVAAAE
jgi:hypothetical protein